MLVGLRSCGERAQTVISRLSSGSANSEAGTSSGAGSAAGDGLAAAAGGGLAGVAGAAGWAWARATRRRTARTIGPRRERRGLSVIRRPERGYGGRMATVGFEVFRKVRNHREIPQRHFRKIRQRCERVIVARGW